MLGPRTINSGASLQHQRSTKLLISRFESLNDASRVPADAPPATPLRPPKQPAASKKDKSPIRQSFRNLLAVFKKGSGLRVGKSKLEDTNFTLPDATLSVDELFTVSPKPTVSTKALPHPQLASSLFYLARSSPNPPGSPGVFPVWTFCSAVLEGGTVHLTWPTTPSTHTVLLKNCTDVRSLTSDELDHEERALLPGDAKDLKVFEVLFDGCTGEKFATTSVRERARWVSAIWDVILPGPGPPVSQGHAVDPDPCSTSQGDSNKITGTNTRPSRPSTLTIRLDRELPPVPEGLRSPTTTLSPRNPVSLNIFPPTRPESRGSSIYSRSKSPSIATLGHLSVVTQRLAQMEGNQKPRSAPASPCRLYQKSSILRTRSLRIQVPSQDDGAGRASPTSILDSYGETTVNGRLSPPLNHPLFEAAPNPSGQDSSCWSQNISTACASSSDAHQSLLTDVHQMMSSVAQRTEETKDHLDAIQTKLNQPSKPSLDFTRTTQALGDINARLRSDLPYIMKLLAQIQACQVDLESKEIAAEAPDRGLEKLNDIFGLLKEDGVQRSVQLRQQTDSVRYLNELNSWLEAFVKQLGSSQEQGTNLLAEIRQLIVNGQARDQTATLQVSIDNLATLVASGSQGTFNPQSIAGLIDQQRQDQAELLRALTAELSSEIRGERLRFVDAMKEATAINVQMHVEELKKELAREVRADLFAYYSKQKQPAAPPQPAYAAQSRMGPPPRAYPNQYGAYN
ncbi:hypothetical protein C8F04DRAFT_435141 [Mycena alexandri]|uniref:PH domain-containing protein n=1 Tax=Mycena alexandri TaxID=1745969 RepID=A0AAD6TF66_9AGAR|nr:hypothetical protein C8F04DRAFT_435141 [Mycena alexandri]